jgi:putative ABC transport system ATP-binding protein
MAQDTFFSNKGFGVQVKGLKKSYRTAAEEVHALKGVDWEVKPGEAIAIMGPSGCGKTTLLNLLGGVDKPTGGEILIDGQKLTDATERSLERHRLLHVGFVFQLFNLIPSMTAFENVELPMLVAGRDEHACRERVNTLLTTVGLGAKGQKRPEQLSGGEQQRVAIAVALANDPNMILADEPTGNLDLKNAETISQLLRSLASDYGKTVIMVSHDPKVVEQFPKQCAMRDGQFVM